MKHFRTNDFLQAVRELLRSHPLWYVEDCVWASLRNQLIDIDQFTAAMRILYPD